MGLNDVEWARTERGLDPIGGRDDFREIMMDLEFPSRPFARVERRPAARPQNEMDTA